jgi:hypothetical protein
MDSWQLIFTKQAEKDARKLVRVGLATQAYKLTLAAHLVFK